MFKAAQTNPYDDIVAKTTDENLTSENWELVLNLCDKVSDEGETGARNVIAALLKRLSHRNANVQLYALSLGDSLQKNCGIHVHREMASKAFTQSLERIVTDRTTHDKVRQRALVLIATWATEFRRDPTLGLMDDCYNNLKSKNYKFTGPDEAPPPEIDDAIRRKEEEELQRVIQMSMEDKGGKPRWADYSAYGSSSSSTPKSSAPPVRANTRPGESGGSSSRYSPPLASSGYVPSAQGPPRADAYTPAPASASTYAPPPSMPTPAPAAAPEPPADAPIPIVTRVRALHTFEPTEAGELAFEKGDVIKVVDRGYKDWWRGQLKGRTGIFPVNYVEPLPEPTAAQLAQEAQQESSVFAQSANVDKLLTLLREFDGSRDNLADNEEIQELYRSTILLRPKIVKLIDKYSQKRADLVSMNESFVKAKSIYERMMDQSLARIGEDGRPLIPPVYGYGPQPGGPGGPQGYGWQQGPQQGGPSSNQPQPGYPGYPNTPGQPATQQQSYAQAYNAQQPGAPYGQYGPGGPQQVNTPTPYPQQAQPSIQPSGTPNQALQQQQQQQPQFSPQLQAQGQVQQQQQQQPQSQAPVQPQPQGQTQAQTQQSGPPYVYDPNGTYPDENATAWARYFAQGGTDSTGAAYFISVPGIKEGPGGPAAGPQAASGQQIQQDAQPATGIFQPQPSHATNPMPQRQDSAGSVASSTLSDATVTGYQPQSHPQPHQSPIQTSFPGAAAVGPTSPGLNASQAMGYMDPPAQGQLPAPMPSAAPGPYGAGGAAAAVYPAGYPGVQPGQPDHNPQGAPWQGQYQGLPNAMGAMSLGGAHGPGSPHEPQPYAPAP